MGPSSQLEVANLTPFDIVIHCEPFQVQLPPGLDLRSDNFADGQSPHDKFNGVTIGAYMTRSENVEYRDNGPSVDITWLEAKYASGPEQDQGIKVPFSQSKALRNVFPSDPRWAFMQDVEDRRCVFSELPENNPWPHWSASDGHGSDALHIYQFAAHNINRIFILPRSANYWNLGDWMSDLNDNMPLFNMIIPATHDSVCAGTANWGPLVDVSAQTQADRESSITQQLDRGIRGFDLRFERQSDHLISVHADWDMCYNPKRIIRELGTWQKGHPGETIIAKIRATKDCADLVKAYMKGEGNEDDLSSYFWLKSRWPQTLGEARGTIICHTENTIGEPEALGGVWGAYWDDGSAFASASIGWVDFAIQDRYDAPSMSEKWDAILRMCRRSKGQEPDAIPSAAWFYNFCGASDAFNRTPRDYAKGDGSHWGMNGELMNWLSVPSESRGTKGVFFLDYYREPDEINALPRMMAAMNRDPDRTPH